MCLALGTYRDAVWGWERGEKGSVRAEMIKKAKFILAAMDAELVQQNKIPQVTYIFRSKNYYGMKDQQEVVVTPTNPVGDATAQKELAERYHVVFDEDRNIVGLEEKNGSNQE